MKNRLFIAFATLAIFATQTVHAQEYLWPTDASRWITSSFAESRPRRFHAAIDIKTWNRSGYKIFAVRDGYVLRLRVSPFGYGKAIYLKLDTGEVVVYAHLSGFNKKLEEIAYAEQRKNGRYRVDRYFSPAAFPVKQGDFLGYTGETGIGVPHLHFEMRDASNRPINPFSRGYTIKDRVAPIPSRVAVLPLRYGSRVNNDFKPAIYSLDAVARAEYRLPEPISFEGEVGLALKCYDVSGGVRNRFGVYEIKLFIDDRPHFRVRYDRFNYAHNRFVELDRDYRLNRRGFGRYYRLFQDPENKLQFYEFAGDTFGRLIFALDRPAQSPRLVEQLGETGPGASNGELQRTDTDYSLAPGAHDLRIEIRDYFDNVATITGTVFAGKKFKIRPEIDLQDSIIVLRGIEGPEWVTPARISLWEAQPGRKERRVQEYSWELKQAKEIGPGEDSGATEARVFPLALWQMQNLRNARPVRLSMTDLFGIHSWPAFYYPAVDRPNAPFAIELSTDFYDDYLRCEVRSNLPLRLNPLIEISMRDGSTRYLQTQQSDVEKFVGTIPLDAVRGEKIRLVAFAESITQETATAAAEFDNYRIKKGHPGKLYAPDGKMFVSFWQGSLYHDWFGRITINDDAQDLRDADLVSRIYEVAPRDVPLNRGAQISIAYPEAVTAPEKLGVYYVDNKKGWTFIDNRIDPEARVVSAKVFSFETFALRLDTTPPAVTVLVPRQNQTLRPQPKIRIRVKDEESGIASEEDMLLLIDGKKMIAEYDPEVKEIIYQPRVPFAPGPHELIFKATDKCRNVTEVRRSFAVARHK